MDSVVWEVEGMVVKWWVTRGSWGVRASGTMALNMGSDNEKCDRGKGKMRMYENYAVL